jgi:hypothetical protein
VKCRDALMALGREHAASEWSGHVNNPPRTADFKGGPISSLIGLARGPRRSYFKAIVDKT